MIHTLNINSTYQSRRKIILRAEIFRHDIDFSARHTCKKPQTNFLFQSFKSKIAEKNSAVGASEDSRAGYVKSAGTVVTARQGAGQAWPPMKF